MNMIIIKKNQTQLMIECTVRKRNEGVTFFHIAIFRIKLYYN